MKLVSLACSTKISILQNKKKKEKKKRIIPPQLEFWLKKIIYKNVINDSITQQSRFGVSIYFHKKKLTQKKKN